MSTPPPTDTPAPLSEEMFEVAVMLAEMGAALTQTGQSNESTALIFKASVALKAGSATIASLCPMTASPEDLVRRLLNADPNVEKSPFTLLYETAYAFEAMAAENGRMREAMKLIAQCLEGSKYKSNMEGRAYGIASQTVATLSSPAPEGTDGGDELVP